MATNGASDRARPAAQAPALKPERSSRRTCRISAPSARSSRATASARSGVSSVELSSSWMCSRSRGQSSCATQRSACSVTTRLVEHRDLQQHMRQLVVGQREGLRVLRAAQLIEQETRDDRDEARADEDQDQRRHEAGDIGDKLQQSDDQAPYPSSFATGRAAEHGRLAGGGAGVDRRLRPDDLGGGPGVQPHARTSAASRTRNMAGAAEDSRQPLARESSVSNVNHRPKSQASAAEGVSPISGAATSDAAKAGRAWQNGSARKDRISSSRRTTLHRSWRLIHIAETTRRRAPDAPADARTRS